MTFDNDFFETDDDYIIAGTEHNGRQAPTLTRAEERRQWQAYRNYAFYKLLMEQDGTSYSSYALDDIVSGKARQTGRSKIDDWYEKIKRERAEREALLKRLAGEHIQNEELRKQLSEME